MTFEELLDQTIAMLQRRGRVTYGALKRQFDLDDAYLEDLKAEIIKGQRLAVDEDGEVLVWIGGAASPPAATSALAQERPPLAYTPSYLTEKILASRASLEGERKQVTVLFADIKDSTELIRDLDPEAAQQLLDPAIHRMMDAVHRFEGTVNQVLGDGIMALFGAPIAHEDHALRACYAALAMQAALRDHTEAVRRQHGLELRVRVGLNAGEVVVRAIGNDLHMDYSAVGQTTHLAARMEQLATPGSIRLTAATLRLVEGLVQVATLGPIPVKGLPEPVEVFELLGASGLRRRLQAAAARGLTRFVGRQRECDAIHQALERAGASHGQAVALVGEAGVGKSRLVYEVVHWRDCVGAGRSPSHHTQGWRVLESASVSYGKATPYFPVIDLLRRYCHVDDGDDARTIRAKVTGQVLTLDEALQETLPALLALLDALPADSPFARLDPPQRRQRTLDALKRVLLRESQVQPLLLVFEDLHWIDAETQALLDSLIESLPTACLLLLVNYRPEYQHAWGSKTYYTQLRLDPLPPASADEFLQALLGDDPSLEPLKRLLIARTEGNPFFLEESVRTLVETGVLAGQPGAYRLAKSLDSLQVPATVHAVLAARIDRLPAEEKRLLQTAAVIGTEVPFALLQAIAELPEDTLHRGLAHLQAAEFLYETRLFPELEYTFKHALTHEVAYGSLLHERRRALHDRIVKAIEGLNPERLAEQVERLAYHALRGELWDKALAYYRQAGVKAYGRLALREAVAYFEQALVALTHLPESRATREQAIDLHLDLRRSLFQLVELGRMFDHLREAETLVEALDDPRRMGEVYNEIAFHYQVMGNYDRAIEVSRRALAIGTTLKDLALQVRTNLNFGRVYWSLGDYRRAMDSLSWNVSYLAGEQLRERFGGSGIASVLSRAWLAWCLAEVGEFPEGIACGEEGVRIAEAADHPFSMIRAYVGVGLLYLRKGDLHRAIPVLERGLRLCQVANIPVSLRLIAPTLGAAYALSGRIAEALPLLEQYTSTQVIAAQSAEVASLSEGYLLAGRLDDAIKLADRALELARAHKERGRQAYALRLLGNIAARREIPEHEQAEAHYRQALALAEELGMRPLLAHCHLGLGTLYARIEQRAPARAELSAAMALYRAMDMTFWLPQAETALAQVGNAE
jgi:class 3 adenylate cyclase/tetratricopeptide (TPR) repeat protein